MYSEHNFGGYATKCLATFSEQLPFLTVLNKYGKDQSQPSNSLNLSEEENDKSSRNDICLKLIHNLSYSDFTKK